MRDTPQLENPAETLARSAFGFASFALIPAIITWIFFWLAPPSPYPIFRAVRWALLFGFGLLLVFLLWLTRYTYITPPEKILPFVSRITTLLGSQWVAFSVVVVITECNILIFMLLRGIAPSITNPSKFLMVAWSFLLIGVVFVIHRSGFRSWLDSTRNLWISTGLFIVMVALVGTLILFNNWLLSVSNANDLIRGTLDYRQLHFYDDGEDTPSPPEFWAEQAQTSVRWSPYTYWVMSEFHGEFINVDASGLRFTSNYGGANQIYIFGGSTVWGEGARDDYTIPSHLARLLNEANNPQLVVNYGQSGYVSSQDLIWFQLQLTRGNIPDIAIFYQGFNDVLSSWGSGVVGITLQEHMRLNDSEAGRQLRSGQPVLQLPNFSLDTYDMSQAGVEDATPQAIVAHWLANMTMVETIANAYGVEVLFVWQPAIIFKDTLSESEQAIYERTENERPGLFDLYRAVDAIVREQIIGTEHDNVLILSDLFVESTEPIFHDLVHITEIGNGIVAETILPSLNDILDE